MPHIGPWDYAAPVYERVMVHAWMHRILWQNHRGKDPEAVVGQHYRQIDLGHTTGKTTAIVKFCEDHNGCIMSDKFTTTDPMFIFDDVSCRNVIEIVARFKPERFVHVGMG